MTSFYKVAPGSDSQLSRTLPSASPDPAGDRKAEDRSAEVIQNFTRKRGKNGPTFFPFPGVQEYGDRMNGVFFDPVEHTAFRPLDRCPFRPQGLHLMDLQSSPARAVNREARNRLISMVHLPPHPSSRPSNGFATAHKPVGARFRSCISIR